MFAANAPFSASAGVVTDPYFSYRKLLLPFDGNTVDVKGHAMSGSAATQAAGQKFGSGCLAATNANGYYLGATSSDFWINTNEDFCVEFWLNPQHTGYGTFFEFYASGSPQLIWLGFSAANDGTLTFTFGNPTTHATSAIPGLTDGTYKHFALYRRGGVVYVGVNFVVYGELVSSASVAYGLPTASIRLMSYSLGGYGVNGQMDDFRFTRGIDLGVPAVPTAAFPTS